MKTNLMRVFPNPFNREEFFTPFDTLMDKVFTESFPELSKEVGLNAFSNSAYPKCDVVNFDDRIEIVAEIPGLSKDQITIDIDDEVITLKGEKAQREEKEGGTYLRRELKKSSFQRTFTADRTIFDLDKIKAKFIDGTLELTIPKREVEKPTKRTIKIG